MSIDEIREIYLKEQGIEEGKELGRSEGKAEAKQALAIELALEMLTDKEPIEKIMKYTKLTQAKILNHKRKLSTKSFQ